MLGTDEQAQAYRIEMFPELVPTKDLFRTGKKVPISLRNVTDHPITLGARMLLGRVSAAPLVLPEEVAGKEDCQKMQKKI